MIRRATLRGLPRPDIAEYAWTPGRVCLVLGDHAGLAAALARRLAARGWQVEAHPAPAAAGGEAGVDDLTARLGHDPRVGAVISVAPRAEAPAAASVADALLGDARAEAWLLAQFGLARRLSASLHATGAARTWFVAVTWLDGRLGLSRSAAPGDVVAAGVHGLVKTLRLEWPSVFCRAIDLHPALDAAFAAERLVEELHDPDQTLAEVGHDLTGRWTVAASEEAHA